MKRPLSRFAAGLALCSVAPVQAATPANCLNPQELHGLITYFLPEVIGEVTKNCGAHLPAESYLRTGLPQLASRLTENKAAAWPVARSAFLKLAEPKDVKELAGLSDKALRPLVDEVMAAKIAIPVNPRVCGDVNDISEALAPLSPDQTVHLLVTIFGAAARNDAKMRSCPRESG